MVGVRKVITAKNDTAQILEFAAAGYDHIALYFYPNPTHKRMGLLPSQMLVCAWRYKPLAGNQLHRKISVSDKETIMEEQL